VQLSDNKSNITEGSITRNNDNNQILNISFDTKETLETQNNEDIELLSFKKGFITIMLQFPKEYSFVDNKYKILAEKSFDEIKNKEDYLKLIHIPLFLVGEKVDVKVLFIKDFYDLGKKPIEIESNGIESTYYSLNKDKSFSRVFILCEKPIENEEKELNIWFDMGKDEIMKLIDSDPNELMSNFVHKLDKSVKAYKLLGEFSDNVLNDHLLAIYYYKKMLDLDPNNPIANNNIGYDFLIYLKDPIESISYFIKAIESDPSYSDAYNNLGYAYNQVGKYELALINYKESIKYGPDNSTALFNIGELLDEKYEFELAIEYYKKAIASFEIKREFLIYNQNHSKAYNNIGNIYEFKLESKMRDIDVANMYYEKAKRYAKYDIPEN